MPTLPHLKFVICAFLLASLLNCRVQAQTAQWQTEKSSEHIKVQSRSTHSGYREIRATMSSPGTVQQFIELLENTEIACQWIANCSVIEVLDSPDDSTRIVRTVFLAPWPVEDREMITRSSQRLSNAGMTLIIDISSAPMQPSGSTDIVRMENIRGQWVIEQKERTISVVYQGYGEPAGRIPMWLANRILYSSIFNTFENLRAKLTDQKTL